MTGYAYRARALAFLSLGKDGRAIQELLGASVCNPGELHVIDLQKGARAFPTEQWTLKFFKARPRLAERYVAIVDEAAAKYEQYANMVEGDCLQTDPQNLEWNPADNGRASPPDRAS
jgi:hypothetical protein